MERAVYMKFLKYAIHLTLSGLLLSAGITAGAQAGDTGDLVSCEINCQDGILSVEAEVLAPDRDIVTGTLSSEVFDSAELLKQLYGEEEKWEYEDGNLCVLDYQKSELPEEVFVSAGVFENTLSFDIKYFDVETQEMEKVLQETRTESPEEISHMLGISAVVTNLHETDSGYRYYQLQELIEGVPTAWLSPVFSKYTMSYKGEYLVDVFYQGNFTVEDTSPVDILSAREALEMIQTYADAGMVHCPPSGADITRIQLCYYLEEIEGTITFRPVWVFSAGGSIWEGEAYYMYEEMLYIDAQDGLLLKYIGM